MVINMKKWFILFTIVFVLFVIGISDASDNNYQIYKANELIERGFKGGWNLDYNYDYMISKGNSIYIKLIYQEEKKQTKMLEQIMKKLNIKESVGD